MLHRISDVWGKLELLAASVLAGTVTLLILLNVATRSTQNALYWVDEAAIYATVAMTFLAASAAVARRETIAITLLPDFLSGRSLVAVLVFVDLMVLVSALAIAWFCWIWFAPIELVRTGFDVEVFQGNTFNFIYAERTTTLGLRKFWFWLIVPVFALGMTLHAVSNLGRSLAAPGDAGIENAETRK